MLPPIARATTISAGISILDPECLSVYAQPSSFDLATWSFSSGNRFRPHRAQLAPYRKNPKPGNPSFSAHSINTSPTLTSWSPDFAGVIALLLPGRHCQRINPPYHAPEQPPREMTLGQHQPVVPPVFHQPAAGLHQALLQAAQRPVVNPPRQHQPPPEIPQVVGNYAQPKPHLV